jgi:hypothetical protein
MSLHLMSASDTSLRDAALALADAGYPVIPLKPMAKWRRCRSGTKPSCDHAVVRKWWARMPDSNIGVVLNDLWVVVIDVDGPEGRASLAWLLAQAGLDHLPDTYTVTTGRPDGGQHYWYRLPAGAVKLVGQYGRDNPTTPHLDILFQGLAVGAGSIHESGATYQGNMAEVPEISALTELPMGLYQVLARRGRPKVQGTTKPPRQRRPAALVKARSRVATAVLRQDGLPRHVKNWLADSTDGRNGRTFKVVTALVRLGHDDQDIIATVLASPLGSKALQQANPHAWVQDKIDAARAYIPPVLDRRAFWQAVHTSGMPPSQMRILDTLLGGTNVAGVIPMSQAWLGINSAVTSAGEVVHTLITEGWLIVVEPHTQDSPTVYRLITPDEGIDEKSAPQVCHPPLPFLSQYGLWRRFLVRHDAFRCRKGSLHLAYPLMMVLGPEPQSMETLAGWLHVTQRALRDRAKSLITAGLAVQSADGLSLTGDPLLPLLDAVAVKVGTAGDRDRAIESYYAKIAAWQLARAEMGEVGSPTWRKKRHARLRAQMIGKEKCHVTLVEYLNGDVDVAAIYLVQQEILMNCPDRETRINGLANLAADLRERAQ